MENIRDERIVLWGDSLGKGVVWNEARARYGYAKAPAASIVEARLGCRINNRAKFGSTAPMGLTLMRRDVAERIPCDAALIEFGGNDCNFDWARISESPEATHEPNTRPEQFAATLREMIALLQNAGIRPILITLPPINPERYFQFFVGDKLCADNVLSWLGDVWQIYRFQEMYSLLIADIAKEFQTQLMDLRARCLSIPTFIRDYLCVDGLHLNDIGQAFAGEQLAELARANR